MQFYKLFFVLSLAGASISSTSNALDIKEIKNQMLETSTDVRIARLKVQASQEALAAARADILFLPRVDIAGRYLLDERFQELEVPLNGSIFKMPAIQPYSLLGINAKINLFSGAKDVYGFRAAQEARDSALASYRRMKDLVVTKVETYYYQALAAQALLGVIDHSIRTLEGHLKNIRARARSGVATRYDILRAELQLERAQTEKIAVDNNITMTRNHLFNYVGIADPGDKLSGELPVEFEKSDALMKQSGDFEKEAVGRSDRQALLKSVEAKRLQVKAARSHWLPRLDVFGSYEWYNNFNHLIWSDEARFKTDYAIGLTLSWNVFDGGRSQSQQVLTQISYLDSQEQLTKFDLNMRAEIDEFKRQYLYKISVFNLQVNSVRKAEEAVRLASSGVRAGVLTNTDLLDAIVDLNTAKAEQVKAQAGVVEALGNFKLSLGATAL